MTEWQESMRKHTRRKLEWAQEKGKGKVLGDESEIVVQAMILASRALAVHMLETPDMEPSNSSGACECRRKQKNVPESEEL